MKKIIILLLIAIQYPFGYISPIDISLCSANGDTVAKFSKGTVLFKSSHQKNGNTVDIIIGGSVNILNFQNNTTEEPNGDNFRITGKIKLYDSGKEVGYLLPGSEKKCFFSRPVNLTKQWPRVKSKLKPTTLHRDTQALEAPLIIHTQIMKYQFLKTNDWHKMLNDGISNSDWIGKNYYQISKLFHGIFAYYPETLDNPVDSTSELGKALFAIKPFNPQPYEYKFAELHGRYDLGCGEVSAVLVCISDTVRYIWSPLNVNNKKRFVEKIGFTYYSDEFIGNVEYIRAELNKFYINEKRGIGSPSIENPISGLK